MFVFPGKFNEWYRIRIRGLTEGGIAMATSAFENYTISGGPVGEGTLIKEMEH